MSCQPELPGKPVSPADEPNRLRILNRPFPRCQFFYWSDAALWSVGAAFILGMSMYTKDIVKVKNLLGHESVATTQIYAAANMDDAGEDIENL